MHQIKKLFQCQYKSLQKGRDSIRFAEICRLIDERKESTGPRHHDFDLVYDFNSNVKYYMPNEMRDKWTGGFDGLKTLFLEPINSDGLHDVC